MGLKTSGETMQSLNNSSRRCVHVNAIFSPPGCALPKWGVGREAIVFTTRYIMPQGAKAGQTVGISLMETAIELLTHEGSEAYGKRHERYLLPRVAWWGCHPIGMPYLSCLVQSISTHNAHEFFSERL